MVVNNPVIERVIERVVQGAPASLAGYVTQADLTSQLAAVKANVNTTLYGPSYPTPASTPNDGGLLGVIGMMGRIDNLKGTNLTSITVSGVSGLTDADIPDSLTASNYLPLAGGTLTGTLTGTNLTLSGNLTVAGAQTLSGAITIPYVNATSTATDSTFVRLTATNATTTNATSTNLFATNASTTNATSTNLFSTLGRFTSAVVDTLLTAVSATITTLTANTLTATNATTTQLDVYNYIAVGRTATTTIRGDGTASTIPYASSTAVSVSGTGYFGTASTTNLTVSGSPSGVLVTSSTGAASASSTLAVNVGGTGITNPSAAGVLLGSYAGGSWQQLATSSLGLLTTNVGEGSNLYYTDARVQSFVHSSSTIPKSYTGNTFSALQQFAAAASTTRFSVFDKAYFGGSATSTFDSSGNLSVAGTLGVTGATTLGNFTATNGTTTNATSTNLVVTGTASTSALVVSNSFTFRNVSGFLKATVGAVATALIDLASDVTGILGVGNGGTGWSNIVSGTLLTGNGSGALSTTTVGNGLSLSAGVLSTSFGTTTANTWNALQQFTGGASSTLLSVYNNAYFGATATSSFASTGALSLAVDLAVTEGGTGASTLTGLLQGNGTSAITAVTGTAGQFPYYNGTNTLLATSTLFISTASNVGIGTTSPVSKLSVLGESAFAGGASVGIGYAGTAAPANGLIIQGNVGIGTTAPSKRLEILGPAGTTADDFNVNIRDSTALAAGVGGGIGFESIYSGSSYARGGTIKLFKESATDGNLDYALTFVTREHTAGLTEKMRINSDGNVGIGTASPGNLVHLYKGTSTMTPQAEALLTLEDDTTVGLQFLPSNGVSKIFFANAADNDRGALYYSSIGMELISGASTRMIIKEDGNVGIGTTTPGAALHVNTTLAATAYFDSSHANGPYIALRESGVDKFYLGKSSAIGGVGPAAYQLWSPSALSFFTGASSATKMVIDTSGNVGIGTTNPNEGKVEVKGGSVCVDTDSNDTATSCIANESDERLKENIMSISASSSLTIINALNPVSFDWRASDPEVLSHYPLLGRYASSTHSIGLIAQQVMPVLPEALSLETVGDSEVQYYQLDYTKFIPHLVGAVKELWAKVQDLGQKIAALLQSDEEQNAKIQTLEARVQTLESQLGAAAAPASPAPQSQDNIGTENAESPQAAEENPPAEDEGDQPESESAEEPSEPETMPESEPQPEPETTEIPSAEPTPEAAPTAPAEE